jgi:hypothetical protein
MDIVERIKMWKGLDPEYSRIFEDILECIEDLRKEINELRQEKAQNGDL